MFLFFLPPNFKSLFKCHKKSKKKAKKKNKKQKLRVALSQRQGVITISSQSGRNKKTLPAFDSVAETYLQYTTACDLLIFEDSFCCISPLPHPLPVISANRRWRIKFISGLNYQSGMSLIIQMLIGSEGLHIYRAVRLGSRWSPLCQC